MELRLVGPSDGEDGSCVERSRAVTGAADPRPDRPDVRIHRWAGRVEGLVDPRPALAVCSTGGAGVGPARLRAVRAAAGTDSPAPGGRILIVDPEEGIRRQLRAALGTAGFEIVEVGRGRAALAAVDAMPPDLVLLDVHLGDIDGFEVLRGIRARHTMPVIFLTADSAAEDRITALDTGADDYILKPFDAGELLARVRAALRRCPIAGDWIGADFGDLVIEGPIRRVQVGRQTVTLTRREYDLLATLAQAPGRVFTRGELLEQVWGSRQDWQDPATVTEHVHRLRRKLERDPAHPRWIATVRHLGYAFSGSVA